MEANKKKKVLNKKFRFSCFYASLAAAEVRSVWVIHLVGKQKICSGPIAPPEDTPGDVTETCFQTRGTPMLISTLLLNE